MEDRKPKISIIVPVYNAEKSIDKCLDSLLNQTLSDMEIIVIDDGSTDNTKRIIEKYKKNNADIVAIFNTNHGYGYSINYGFSQANGKYVGIVESDDFVDNNMYADLFEKMEAYNLDFVKSNRITEWTDCNGKSISRMVHCDVLNGLYNEVVRPVECPEWFQVPPDTWSGIYRKEFLEREEILHNESEGASYQDLGFSFLVYVLAQRAMIIDRGYYHYRIDNINSSIHNRKKVHAVTNEYIYVYNCLLSKFNNIPIAIENIFYMKKYSGYMFTLNRIDKSYAGEYVDFMKEEYLHDIDAGKIDDKLFSKDLKSNLDKILSSKSLFLNDFLNRDDRLIQKMKESSVIILYGTGNIAMDVWGRVRNDIERSKCFFANTKPSAVDKIDGVQVKTLFELKGSIEDATVFVLAGELYRDEMANYAKDLGYKNIEVIV